MSNKKFGYARVSTAEQNEDRQVLELLEYGIEERDIYVDKQSGRSFERTNYMSLRNSILRNGDILVVKSIDRFGRNYSGIRTEWEYLTKTLGVDIVVLDTPILDTTRYKDLLGSVITDIVLAVLSFGAQLEVDTKSKAQAEGIAAAHLKGVKFGRPKCSVNGNVKKCAVGKYPKSEKHGNTAQFSEVERSGTQENCGGIGSSCRLRLRPLPVLRRRQSQRVARIDPNAVVVDKNIAENDRFDLFSRQLVRRDLVDLLFLERGKKALHPCVVEAMSGAAEALYHAAARQLGTKS